MGIIDKVKEFIDDLLYTFDEDWWKNILVVGIPLIVIPLFVFILYSQVDKGVNNSMNPNGRLEKDLGVKDKIKVGKSDVVKVDKDVYNLIKQRNNNEDINISYGDKDNIKLSDRVNKVYLKYFNNLYTLNEKYRDLDRDRLSDINKFEFKDLKGFYKEFNRIRLEKYNCVYSDVTYKQCIDSPIEYIVHSNSMDRVQKTYYKEYVDKSLENLNKQYVVIKKLGNLNNISKSKNNIKILQKYLLVQNYIELRLVENNYRVYNSKDSEFTEKELKSLFSEDLKLKADFESVFLETLEYEYKLLKYEE